MSRQITQPVNQVRLTNVAVVRLSRGGNRFEVACYRNKIVNYRQGTETDLSEVLQTTRVFTNVSKGQFAKSSLLEKCFGTSDEEEVCRFILEKGDVQVSDLERNAQLESTIREVASMVSEKCVHPVSRRPYTMAQVRDAMKMAGFMVHPTRNTKQQFLDCVRLLQNTEVLSIERAKMQLALVFLSLEDEEEKSFETRRNAAIEMLVEAGVSENDIQAPAAGNSNRVVFLSDPSHYRQVDAIARDASVKGRVEIIQQCLAEEGDVALGSELERRALQHHQHHINDHAVNTNQSMKGDDNSIDGGDEQLSSELQTMLNIKESTDDDTNDIHAPEPKAANSRKAQKAAQKKSKKAKRREKEEQADREDRIAAEKTRQRERAERLGLADNDGNNGATANGKSEDANASGGDTKPCNTCGGAFTPGEYRSHFRSDWHRYNVKLKMKGVSPVSEKEFLLCDSDAFFD
mmetsp:Transcript_16901/g.35479  ORF Transcript_16901/g.35479 Transcript_16901/m.35479 type:complete len:461 (-) Transcript_16901:97-1479(-)